MNKAMSWILTTLAVPGLFVGMALAGPLDAPGPTNSPASAMWTLNDIYTVLDTRTTNITQQAAFNEPAGGPTSGTMHTLNDIMALATNRAPVPWTGQTNSWVAGDDGATRIGVAWPNPRFSAVATSGEATNQIRDNLTGLIWARNANLAINVTGLSWTTTTGTCTWYQAFDVITNIAGPVNGTNNPGQRGYGGTNDWRMPNLQELRSLIDASKYSPALSTGHPFKNVTASNYYWANTTDAAATTSAWRVYIFDGGVDHGTKSVPLECVWPVRGCDGR